MVELSDKLTLKEVARELNRSLEQVRRYVREGRLPAQKLGMQWFVERRDLDAFKSAAGKESKESWEELLLKIRANREAIRKRVGNLDIDRLLDESRDGHP